MKKIKILLCLTFALVFNVMLFAQEDPADGPGLPGDGEGEYLDEVPIAGEVYFLIAALGAGGFILLRRQKKQNAYVANK